MLADGTRTVLARCEDPLQLYVLAGDRLEGPIEARAYPVKSRFVLLNDAALSALGVAIVDPKEGLWCFRDELGRRERRGA